MARVERTTAQAAAEVIRTETVEHTNTAERVGGNLKQLADSALWLPLTGSEHTLLRKHSTGEGAWTTQVWSDGTYLGVGASVADLPAAGALRLAVGTGITARKPTTGETVYLLKASAAGSDIEVTLGDVYVHAFGFLCQSSGAHYFYVGGVYPVSVTSGGLTVTSGYTLTMTGGKVRTSTGSLETVVRGETAVDTGEDASAVAVVAYTVPEGYKATIRCWVCGEWDSDRLPVHDCQWTIKVYRDTAGDVTEYSAAVTPETIADPDLADVTITYGLSGGVVTLYKQNASETPMVFAGQMDIKLDLLEGSGV